MSWITWTGSRYAGILRILSLYQPADIIWQCLIAGINKKKKKKETIKWFLGQDKNSKTSLEMENRKKKKIVVKVLETLIFFEKFRFPYIEYQ